MRCTCNLCEKYSVNQVCQRVGRKTKPFFTCDHSQMWWEKYYASGQNQNQLPWSARDAFAKRTAIYRNTAPVEVEIDG